MSWGHWGLDDETPDSHPREERIAAIEADVAEDLRKLAIVRRDGEDDVVDCPSCQTESLTDDYNHGGHCPVCGQFNWEYNEHRHGSLRTAGPRRRFNQDWQHIGGDYVPLDVISHYMDRKGEGFGDEKSHLYEMNGRPPLSQQIKQDGYEKPVELATDGKSGIIYDGHHRIDIARQLGHTHVPVTVSWRNSTGYDDGAYGNKIEPWLKSWLTDMRGGRETVGRRTAAPRKPQDPQAVVDRIKALNHRHFLHYRSNTPVPDRLLAQHPPLSVREEAERQQLNSMTSKLQDRWNEMEPLTDNEMALHQALYPMDHRKDDLDSMSDGQKAEHFADLHHLPEVAFGRMPREQNQYDRLKPWAEQHFGNMQNDAQDEVERHRQYLDTGRHPTGVTSLEGLDGSHHPDLTGAWASELSANGTSKRLRARQEDYHAALGRVATHGPLQNDPMAKDVENRMYAFKHLETARNHLRVELQHAYLFKVPHIDELSPIDEPSERHARSGLANPRYAHGTGGRTTAAMMAYQVNCQRCVLAAEARHRGHNVEARPNYRDATDSSANDRQFKDHDIASWFRNADGTVPKWIDAEDADHPSAMNRSGEPLKLKHFGEQQWDHMHEQIKSWGPGARAAVVMSTPTLTDNSYTRHIIHAVVDDDGKVNYIDPQTGNNDASHHRESIGYSLHPENQTKRLWLDKRPIEEDDKVTLHNKNMSPLRFMRLDDKQLSPEVAQHVVDRGTAGGRGIIPPDTTT